MAAGLAVLFHWVSGLIFYLVEKDSTFIKFYALQSIALDVLYVVACIAAGVLGIAGRIMHLPLTFLLGTEVLWVVQFILWVILLVNAFQGKVFELPLVGKWCRSQSGFTG